MIYDIKIDIGKRDCEYEEHLTDHEFHSVKWGSDNHTCQVLLERFVSDPIYLYIPYKACTESLNLVQAVGDSLSISRPCLGYINGELVELTPAKLMLINPNGYYAFIPVDNVYHVYTAANTDFLITNTSVQAAKLMCLCAPGKNYRYPTTGVGLSKYLNSIIERTDIGAQLLKELSDDGIFLDSADYNTETYDLQLGLANSDNHEDIMEFDTSLLTNPDLENGRV